MLKGKNKENTLFIFDEPTTGLHFHDIKKLLKSFNYLIEYGHSIIVVEHNIDLIKSSDHIIDLGPYGGDKGGEVVFTGTPEKLGNDKKAGRAKGGKPKVTRKEGAYKHGDSSRRRRGREEEQRKEEEQEGRERNGKKTGKRKGERSKHKRS